MRCTEPGARAGLRADERGGASAEGAIVASFLVMIFAACLFVAQSLTRGAAAIATSRTAVWSRALDRCPRGPEDVHVQRALGGYRRGAEAISPVYAAHFDDVRAALVTASTTRSGTAPEAAGGRTVTFTETSETACNPLETPWDTDPRAAALDYFCRQHPEPLWPEGCDPAVTTRGRP